MLFNVVFKYLRKSIQAMVRKSSSPGNKKTLFKAGFFLFCFIVWFTICKYYCI